MRWMKAVIWMSTGSQNPLTTSSVSMPKRMNITNAVGPNHFLAGEPAAAERQWLGPTAVVMLMLFGNDTVLVVSGFWLPVDLQITAVKIGRPSCRGVGKMEV